MTGKGIRVAVIDSGVHTQHPHIYSVSGGVSIAADGTAEEHSYSDQLGHGTAVMAAIQEKAPDAEYFAVKVFHSALRTTTACLFAAIEWSIRNRMDLINLSLGTLNARSATEFTRLAQQGTLLVSARETNGQPCYPGCLPDVVGVSLDWECERDRYRVDETGFYTSGYPRPIPGVPQQRNLNGISFAVANMTGFIARAYEELPVRSPSAVKALLQRQLQ